MTNRALVLSLLLLVPGIARAQAPSIEGVWRITEVVTTGANAATVASPQSSLLIFARGHYSWVTVNGSTPRPQAPAAKDPANPTAAEKAARYDEWQPFTANSGTYEVTGTTLTRRLMVAKNVGAMNAKNPTVQEFKLEGDTLWLTQRSAAGQPASETRTRLARVK